MAESLDEDYVYTDDDDDDDDDADPDDYYGGECMDEDQEPVDEREPDPEHFDYKCLTVPEAKSFLQSQVEEICSKLKVCYGSCQLSLCIKSISSIYCIYSVLSLVHPTVKRCHLFCMKFSFNLTLILHVICNERKL